MTDKVQLASCNAFQLTENGKKGDWVIRENITDEELHRFNGRITDEDVQRATETPATPVASGSTAVPVGLAEVTTGSRARRGATPAGSWPSAGAQRAPASTSSATRASA